MHGRLSPARYRRSARQDGVLPSDCITKRCSVPPKRNGSIYYKEVIAVLFFTLT